VITLQQLLRLSFANAALWLSEQPKDAVPVHWIVLTIDEIDAGDVLLISGKELRPEILARTKSRGGSAVISWGQPVGDLELHPDSLPITVVPQDQAINLIHRTLLTILINQRAHLMERGVRIHTQLAQIEAEGLGISELVIAMSEISGRDVLVQDKRLRILSDCASSTLNSIWGDILDFLIQPDHLPEELRDRKEAGRKINILAQSIPGGIARIIIPIVVAGVARGYLSLIGLEGEFDALDNLVLEQGALVCGIDMARTKAVREAEKGSRVIFYPR